MTDAPLFVFAKIRPKPEHHEKVRTALRGILEVTRAEPGCRRFDLLEADDGTAFHLAEEWDDKAALDRHYAQPYVQAVMPHYDVWLAEPLTVWRAYALA